MLSTALFIATIGLCYGFFMRRLHGSWAFPNQPLLILGAASAISTILFIAGITRILSSTP